MEIGRVGAGDVSDVVLGHFRFVRFSYSILQFICFMSFVKMQKKISILRRCKIVAKEKGKVAK